MGPQLPSGANDATRKCVNTSIDCRTYSLSRVIPTCRASHQPKTFSVTRYFELSPMNPSPDHSDLDRNPATWAMEALMVGIFYHHTRESTLSSLHLTHLWVEVNPLKYRDWHLSEIRSQKLFCSLKRRLQANGKKLLFDKVYQERFLGISQLDFQLNSILESRYVNFLKLFGQPRSPKHFLLKSNRQTSVQKLLFLLRLQKYRQCVQSKKEHFYLAIPFVTMRLWSNLIRNCKWKLKLPLESLSQMNWTLLEPKLLDYMTTLSMRRSSSQHLKRLELMKTHLQRSSL